MLIILSAVTIKTVTDLKIIEFAIKGTEDYSKAQDKEMEEFGKIENLLADTISNIGSGNTPTTPSEPEGPDTPVNNPITEADIGKYLNYVPQGIDYTVEAKYSGDTSNQLFKQDTNLKWRIWKVENDILYLISDILPNTSGYNNEGNLYLGGAQGYNNGVTILDKICQSNYGVNGNSNVKVQNLKVEDVIEVKSDKVDLPFNYGKQPYTYQESGTFAFPSIWYSKERESSENKSIAYPYVEVENSTTPASSQKPYYTFWQKNSMNNAIAWKSGEYHNMVMNPAQAKEYWLSSRFVWPYSSTSCSFGLYYMYSSGINDGFSVYDYNNGTPAPSSCIYGIRPLVSIPLKTCEITENATTENTFDIVIK